MESSVFFILVGALIAAFIPATVARDFYVGDNSGWTDHAPSGSYINWAEGNRFQINDTLVFKYKAYDSVLVVSKADYDACDINTPLQRLQGDDDDGSASFKFNRSGAFHFISGAAGHCQKGQKMIVVVLAVRDINVTGLRRLQGGGGSGSEVEVTEEVGMAVKVLAAVVGLAVMGLAAATDPDLASMALAGASEMVDDLEGQEKVVAPPATDPDTKPGAGKFKFYMKVVCACEAQL